MNKYQKQISPTQAKKPAHLKKNPAAHQAWLTYKKTRNQAQRRKHENN